MDHASASGSRNPARRARRGGPLLAIMAVAGVVGGCTHVQSAKIDRHVIVGSVPEDYRTMHPIAIEEGVQTLDVPAGLNTVRLTEGEKGNIAGFAQRFLESDGASMAIVTPAGSTNQASARALAGQIQAELVGDGISPGAIEFRSYRAEPSELTAPIRLAYSKIGAHTAECGPWPDQSARNPENRNYANFGCASQQNLAAMVANPLDLLYPRAMPPPDAARRTAVVGASEGVPGVPKPTGTQSDYSVERAMGGTVSSGVSQ